MDSAHRRGARLGTRRVWRMKWVCKGAQTPKGQTAAGIVTTRLLPGPEAMQAFSLTRRWSLDSSLSNETLQNVRFWTKRLCKKRYWRAVILSTSRPACLPAAETPPTHESPPLLVAHVCSADGYVLHLHDGPCPNSGGFDSAGDKSEPGDRAAFRLRSRDHPGCWLSGDEFRVRHTDQSQVDGRAADHLGAHRRFHPGSRRGGPGRSPDLHEWC